MIAVVPRFPEEDSRFGGPPDAYGQRLAYDPLHEAGGDRFAMFDLENSAGTPIYVHAKVCVVDDHWMTIGSDNLNLRSWTHDSELTCAIVDPDGELPRTAAHCAVGRAPRASGGRPAARRPRAARSTSGAGGSAPRQPDPRRTCRRSFPAHAAWAGPAYRVLYDPDGRPRRLRGTTEF